MKTLSFRIAAPFLAVALCAVSLRAESTPEERATWTKAADNHIYAQQLVNDMMARHPELLVIGMHGAAPGTDDHRMIASNLDRIGKKDDDDDIGVAAEHKTICAPNLKETFKFEVLMPLKDASGTALNAAIGFVFKYTAGDDEVKMHALAVQIRDELAAKIPSYADLFKPAAAPLVPGVTIQIPSSHGKFDFLAVDEVNHRLLAAHEKDGTADFLDINSKTVLARVKTGPTVGIVRDPKTGNYFCSVQDDKRLAVIDPVSLKETASIAMPAETDAIIFDAKDRLVFVTNDNGKFLWAVNADTQQLAASIQIPSAPECMAYDGGTDRVYLNLKEANQVAVIDIKTMAIVAQWPTAPVASPHGMAFDAATSRIFSAGGNGKLVSIDSATGAVVGSADITAKVDQIAFDDSTKRVYCAGADWMSVVQETPGGLKLLGVVKTAATAKNVAVDPATHDVWTTYTDGTDSFASSWISP